MADDREMDFFEHLEELRIRLIRSIVYVAMGMVVAWRYASTVLEILLHPIRDAMPEGGRTIYTHVLEPFTVQIQIALVAGLLFAAPLVLYEIWAFVAPGLLPHERRYVLYTFPASVVLFFAGALTAYFALPVAFRFLLQFMPPGTEIYQSVKVYLFFLLRMLLAFGVVFQAPLVLMFLALLEVISLEFLLSKWRHAVFTCFVIAAIVTPTWDPINMSLLAMPLILLYGLSLVLVWGVELFRERRRAREEPQIQAAVEEAVAEMAEPLPAEEEQETVEVGRSEEEGPSD
jgi:sec-independent protein translocase protein TatC